jgi:hypothetical protein
MLIQSPCPSPLKVGILAHRTWREHSPGKGKSNQHGKEGARGGRMNSLSPVRLDALWCVKSMGEFSHPKGRALGFAPVTSHSLAVPPRIGEVLR